MNASRDVLYLTHITETIDHIRSSGPDGPAALESNPDIRDATLYRLQTLSESASLLAQTVKDRHPEIPWAAIAGFRNRLGMSTPCGPTVMTRVGPTLGRVALALVTRCHAQ